MGANNPNVHAEAYARTARDMPDELKSDLWLTIMLHQNGALSVQGTIADKALCLRLLDEAKDAINRQGVEAEQLIVTPGDDVSVRRSA